MSGPNEIARGSIITVVLPGSYGKPRRGLVVQANRFLGLQSVVVCLLTSFVGGDGEVIRPAIAPSETNGLRALSQIAVDKVTAVPWNRVGNRIGEAEAAIMLQVDAILSAFFGIV